MDIDEREEIIYLKAGCVRAMNSAGHVCREDCKAIHSEPVGSTAMSSAEKGKTRSQTP